jgi:aspartate dehydrogenase
MRLVSAVRRVGVVGLGAIGRALCRALDEPVEGVRLVGALARDRDRGEAFLATLRSRPRWMDLEELVAATDLVVEATSQAHLEILAPRVLEAGRDLVVLSCGALLNHPEWIARAREHRCRIYVPSGAMAGLDAVKGACVGSVDRVMLETRKPPQALAGAPWVVEHGVDLQALRTETLLYEGPAAEACRAFPANVNVAAALALAGPGPDRTWIRIYAVPGLDRNLHRVTVEGEFGRLRVELENVPSENPRTGRLSALSAIALLRDLGAPLRVGT